ncbi:MAG: tetratricopeptide repeat protein, partial [Deltaproteobacteria bacterium]|nr:tetratricopeptide repeat protein [Deltaproteobacteria bacterium]
GGDPRLAEAERLFRDQRYEEAARAGAAAEAGGPLGAGGYLLIGLAMSRAGDPFHAVPKLAEAVRLDPASADAWYELGWAYETAGDKDQATDTWKAAADRFPGDPRFALVLRGR